MSARGILLGAGAALLGASLYASSATAQVDARQLEAAARIIDAEAAGHQNGSMTVALVVRGEVVWVRSYGYADEGRTIPATSNTVYRIGSITKQFTGFALLKAVAEGHVRLEDRVIDYLPELGPVLGADAPPVDLLALATHRAGLAREPDDPDYAYSTGVTDQWRQLANEALAHTRAPYAPNERSRYSNIGYAALGLAIERASGIDYVTFVEDRLIRPLDMHSTSFRPDEALLARLAVGYRSSSGSDTAESKSEIAGRGYRIPNGGLFSTASDMARFLAFEMGAARHPPLDNATLEANFGRSFPSATGNRFGVGFTEEAHGERRLVGHNGLTTGYASSAFFDPEERIGVICLASAEDMCQSRFIDVYAELSPAWVPVAEALRAAKAASAARVVAQQPYPQGEVVLRRFIGELASGAPDYDALGEVLGGAVRDNLTALRNQFSGLGPLQSVAFLRVDPGGADVYETRFAGGALHWTLTVGEGDILETATMRTVP